VFLRNEPDAAYDSGVCDLGTTGSRLRLRLTRLAGDGIEPAQFAGDLGG
jgi:hypothetical protein